ncbi:MAG: hypothetical protein ACTSXX_02640 [Candidatus Baldrarchaeia archaeon]
MSPYLEPIARKKRYLKELASIEGIDLSMRRWGAMLPFINLDLSFAVIFRILLDIYLNLDLHFDPESFEWHPLDFTDLWTVPMPKVTKAKYGESQYDASIYDPENVTGTSLERLLWDVRKKTTEKDSPFYKQTSKALMWHFDQIRDFLKKKDVKPEYIEAMFEKLILAEGLLTGGCFVGFMIVGLSRVGPRRSSAPYVIARDPRDLKTEVKAKGDYVYGPRVGFIRVGYFRVGRRPEDRRIKIKREVAEHVKKRIEEFRKRVGPVGPPEAKILHQRLFFLQREEKLHWRGGEHQLTLQRIINAVKRILDRHGIIAQFRLPYITFAKELYYLYYDPHRLYKRWKKILTEDDIFAKYKRMGLDEGILNEIKGVLRAP